MGQYDLPRTRSKTHPELDLSDPKYDEIKIDQAKGESISPMEDAVDAHIQHNKMNADDVFSVRRSSGETEQYKYLGPNSGGRKDWIKIKQSVPTS